jgi:hypothetical protein
MFRMIPDPPPGNWLLKTLSAEDQALVTPHLERVSIKRWDLLEVAGEPFPYVYFPVEGLISVVARMQDGKPVEVGMVGREGMTGASVVLDDLSAQNEVRVQIGGTALRISIGCSPEAGFEEPIVARRLSSSRAGADQPSCPGRGCVGSPHLPLALTIMSAETSQRLPTRDVSRRAASLFGVLRSSACRAFRFAGV